MRHYLKYIDSQPLEFKGFWDTASNDEIAIVAVGKSLGELYTIKPP